MRADAHLPAGWESRSLRSLCGKPQYGYTESATSEPVGPRFLRITDIQDGTVNWPTVPYCQCNEDQYRIKNGDLLFARIGGTTGKSFLVKDAPVAVFASYLIRVRPGPEILPEFLAFYFRSPDYWESIETEIEDGNRPTMNGTKLAQLMIPVPPLDAQHQIVGRIESLTMRAQELAEQTQAIASDMLRAVTSLYERLVADAPQQSLQEVASLVRRPIATVPDGSYPELGLRSFGKGTFHKPALSGTEVGNKRIYRIHAGDLVFSNVFGWEGAIAVAQPEDDGRAGSHRYITYLANSEQATPEFLCFHFLTAHGLEAIRAASPGSAGRNRTLGLARLKQIKVPVPPIEEQRRFSELVKRQREITRLANAITEDLRRFEAALLAKAFRGEL